MEMNPNIEVTQSDTVKCQYPNLTSFGQI